MLQFLAAIPIIGKLVDLTGLLVNGVIYGTKWLVWKISLGKLMKRKENIQNAENPGDWTSIFKR